MAMRYLIGVDGGSQSSKVVIFDLDGNVVCEGHQELQPMHLPEPGVAEHPDDDLWDSTAAACRAAMAAFPGDPKDIVGVGIGSIRCCRVLMKADGTLAAPVISWMDRRTARPYEHDVPDVAYVTATTGYINHRFTGAPVDTAANYVGEWPVDNDSWDWSTDPAAFERYNVPRAMLFDLAMPGAIIGHVTEAAARLTGIPAGLPVVNTANDKAVEALGMGLMSDDAVLISLGTYICGMTTGARNITDAAGFWTNLACEPRRYLYESGGIRRGMWTVSWFKQLIGDDLAVKAAAAHLPAEALLECEAARTPAGAEGLMIVPEWLAPPHELYRKGAILGFDGRHGRGHIYRAILEAIALTMKGHSDAMFDDLAKRPQKVIVSGGGSNSDLFMQIFADVFGLTAERNVVHGAAGLGAAICAAVATGQHADFDSAVAAMVRTEKSFAPQPANVALYDRVRREVYAGLREGLAPILQRSYPIFG
ncbi:MAG: FGGY-family carbohydrate kinase [Ancalomicrobiaceae bacterium]|nr:FGGY-family carbohydrate kinase [Ancalomicrobiaceae bacterium]